MKARLVAVAIAATLFCASPTNAEMSFAGAGASPCSLLNANAPPDPTQSNTAMVIFTWVQGFLSGMNGLAFNLPDGKAIFDLDAVPSQTQWRYLIAYCQANPTALIATAAIDLGTKRLRRAN
jgi:hypothetical protein